MEKGSVIDAQIDYLDVVFRPQRFRMVIHRLFDGSVNHVRNHDEDCDHKWFNGQQDIMILDEFLKRKEKPL